MQYYKDNDGAYQAFDPALAPEAAAAMGLAPTSEAAMQAERQSAAILSQLAAIDARSVRPLRAIARGEAVRVDTDKLAALDAEAAALRTELAGL
jgi:hypothetical protein